MKLRQLSWTSWSRTHSHNNPRKWILRHPPLNCLISTDLRKHLTLGWTKVAMPLCLVDKIKRCNCSGSIISSDTGLLLLQGYFFLFYRKWRIFFFLAFVSVSCCNGFRIKCTMKPWIYSDYSENSIENQMLLKISTNCLWRILMNNDFLQTKLIELKIKFLNTIYDKNLWSLNIFKLSENR